MAKDLNIIYGFKCQPNEYNNNLIALNTYKDDEVDFYGKFAYDINPRLIFIEEKKYEYLGIPIAIMDNIDTIDYNDICIDPGDISKMKSDLYNLLKQNNLIISYNYKPQLYIFESVW